MKPFYLMESKKESERLLIKSSWEKTAEQLKATGLLNLPPQATVVDAGSGVGHVAEVMGELLRMNTGSTVILLDQSSQRLDDAKARINPISPVDYEYIPCGLSGVPLKNHCADYVFCRFVFEYLSDPKEVFNELVRILKPGGKLVIGDLDYNCMTHYPLEEDLERELELVMSTLQSNHFFDPYMGRKLYSYFYKSPLEQIKVHFSAHHLFYGALSSADEFNWLAKIDQLIELKSAGTIQLDIDLERFRSRFHEFLKFPGRFSYTPLILVEGTKPHE